MLTSEEQLQSLGREHLDPTHPLLLHPRVQLPPSLGGSPPTPPVHGHGAQPALHKHLPWTP